MTFDEIMEILSGWEGTPGEKLRKWHETLNFIIWPPDDDDPESDREAALYIFNHQIPQPQT